MTTETSFSWNFDTGTLTEASTPSLQEPVQGRGSLRSYGGPLSACLPVHGSDEPVETSKKSKKRVSVHFGDESEKLLRNRPDKVQHFVSGYFAMKATIDIRIKCIVCYV